jgi:hypothetical protein
MAQGVTAKGIARIVVDVVMAAVYVAVMATALVQEAPHEYLGIALFALVVVHVVLNRRWFAALARGRYDALRVMQLVAVVGLLICILAQGASSLVLSKHAFGFLPALPGASWARRVHMLCSYWGFVFASAHAGLQFRAVLVRLGAGRSLGSLAKWLCRAAFVAIACFGAWSFAALGLPAYLAGQVQFAFADFDAPLALTFAQYASIGVLVAGVFYYVARLLRGHGNASKDRKGER